MFPTDCLCSQVNRTGESAMEDKQERNSLMQMLPGMRQVVSPFRHMAETFDNSQFAVGLHLPKHLPPRKDVLSVVLNRGVYDKQIKGLSVVADTHGGLYEPGATCTSLHGPRCNAVKAHFSSAVGYQIFAPPQTNLESNPVIKAVAEEHLKGLLGGDLLRRIKAAGLLQKDGIHYRVPDSVLPRYLLHLWLIKSYKFPLISGSISESFVARSRYDVSGAGTPTANGSDFH